MTSGLSGTAEPKQRKGADGPDFPPTGHSGGLSEPCTSFFVSWVEIFKCLAHKDKRQGKALVATANDPAGWVMKKAGARRSDGSHFAGGR
jgi:hypothetical protein